ncbi:YqaA family protein [Rhabdaerophilum sp. SD176]|jgi:membrane protein YqaA with SNARE-associated domain|uniref:YqaA family protein n=1 Tax=Rhabdaerophilum sp. SD176 TaxID=2983548 RepID=UPI0024E009E3|nr:YqaA family protein [Rhabdaerophilum sp. SD176]
MFKQLYDWTIGLANSRRAPQALAAVSFAESSFFPVPPDVMLVPMTMARPERAWHYAAICTIASVLGGIAGYLIGALLYDTLGAWLIRLYGYGDKMDAFRTLYQQHGHWIILIKGFTPIPFKLITIASGLAGYDFLMFVLLSTITRGARFFLVAGVMNRFGGPIRHFIEANLTLVGIVTVVAIIGGFAAAKFFF